MTWIQKLHETYGALYGREPEGSEKLEPVSHIQKQAHVEVTLDGEGNFVSARAIGKAEIVIPATEASAGRTTNRTPHPLCDNVQYCAADYKDHGGKESFFGAYESQLENWCSSPFGHAKARAVLSYVRKGTLIADLIREKVLFADESGQLLTRWDGDDDSLPELFKALTAKAGKRSQGDAFICWRVREPGSLCTATWEDVGLQEAWVNFDAHCENKLGFCMVTGETQARLAMGHAKRLRHPGDGAKIISTNDTSGFTFRGRFNDDGDGAGQQACTVSHEASQKAHIALRWLIKRQSYRKGDQVVVSWSVGGAPIPDPFRDSLYLLAGADAAPDASAKTDAGQSFATRLRLAMKGYSAKLDPSSDVIVMGLDSATSGRLAITYYRELKSSEFLDRIERWHAAYAWHQNFGKDRNFVGAPSPGDIADAAYGQAAGKKDKSEKLKKATIERLLPCIIDGQRLPRDLLESTVRRATNRAGLAHFEWEKVLGIACGLYRGASKNEEYDMALETNRRSRDYLYGRLLAIAEHIENIALHASSEKRDTNAARMMQRFASRPASTWRQLEMSLRPYISRLRAKRGPFMYNMSVLLDETIAAFGGDDFMNDRMLSGEFLLGYHCQMLSLRSKAKDKDDDDVDADTAEDSDHPDTTTTRSNS